jgi:hypothetical protein
VRPAASSGLAGKIRPLVLKPGQQAAGRWAEVTVDAIMEPDGTESLPLYFGLRARVKAALERYFLHAGKVGDVRGVARGAAQEVVALAGTTKWRDTFAHPAIRAAIEEIIARNLKSAATAARY